MSSRHLLLICPQFFSYHHEISEAANALGIRCTWVDGRPYQGAFYKSGLKFVPAIFRNFGQDYYKRKFVSLHEASITDVLLIKGDGISLDTTHAIRDAFPEARMVLYLWDSIENNSHAIMKSFVFDETVTFDPNDARDHGWRYQPLFSRQAEKKQGHSGDFRWNWSFVGSLHSDRHSVLSKLAKNSKENTYFVFLYVQNNIVKFLKGFRDKSIFLNSISSVHTEPVSTQKFLEILTSSRVVVDIEHPKQSGLTMRTVETILEGKKLATTNSSIKESDLFDKTRVHVLDRDDPHIPVEFYQSEFLPLPKEIVRKYTSIGWLKSILDGD